MESKKNHKIGRGKNMSIAKAALIVFYKHYPQGEKDTGGYIYTGDLDVIHEIVDIAGANHCSFLTHPQVIGCIRGSSYWKSEGQVESWKGSSANCYIPSDKGKAYYEKHLKK